MGAGAPQWLLRGTPAYRRVSIGLFLAGFSTFSLLYCVQPLLPAFAADFGVSPAESSLALSLSTGALSVAILCAAAVSEGVGRRGLMFASLALAGLLNLLAAAAPGWEVLLLVRAAEGFVLGGVPAVAMAYLSEEVDPKGLGLAMGLYVGGNAFGGMSGRVITGVVAEAAGWRMALALIGVLGLLAATGFVLLLPPSRNFVRRRGFDARFHAAAWLRHGRDPGMQMLFAIGFLVMGGFVTVYNYAGFRLTAPPYDLDQEQLGLIFTAYLFGIAASSMAGWLADRVGRRAVLPAGVVAAGVGAALTMAAGLPAIVAGIAVLTIGFFTAHSVASSWVGRRAMTAKGHASSLYLLAYYLGSSVAGSAGGVFWAWDGWDAVIAYTLGLFLLALLAAHRLRGIPPNRPAEG